jgi:hypothetical protein
LEPVPFDVEIGGVDRPLLYLVTMTVLVGCFGGGGGESESAYSKRECNSGFSCENEARGAKTPAEVMRLFKRSCDLDYAGGCLSLAYAYRTGAVSVDYHDVPIPKSPDQEFAAYDRACTLKNGGGCVGAANMILKSETTTHGDAAPFLEKACDLKVTSRESDNCARAGDARLAAQDEDRALALYKLGCTQTMGAPDSCIGYAEIEIKRGHTADIEKPLGDACFFGKSGKACKMVGKLARDKGDTREAAWKFRDACKYGDQEACTLAGDADKAREAQLTRESAERDRQWEEERKKANAMSPPTTATASRGTAATSGTTASPSSGAQTIHMKDASANGVHAKTLDCTLQSGNVMGSFILLAGLADRTSALRACGIKKSFTAEWTMSNGAITSASAHGTGTPATDACAARALRQMKQTFTGTCTAELSLE